MSHRSDEALLEEMRRIVRQTGKAPSQYSVKRTFAIGSSRADKLLAILAGEIRRAAELAHKAKQDELPLAPPVPDFLGDDLVARCAQAAFKANQRSDFNAPAVDTYRSIARAVLVEAMQERN